MPISDNQALNLYVQSIEAHAKAEVCIRHSSTFALPFHERFAAWQKANAEALTKGASIANERGMNSSTSPSLQSFAAMNAQILDALPNDDRQRRCDELLASFSVR